MRWTAIPLSLIVFVLLYVLFGRDTGPAVAPQPVEVTPPEAPQLQVSSTAAEPLEPNHSPACLSEAQVETHPSLLTEMSFLNEVQVLSEYMRRYRGLQETDLESLAEQGDSGAMAMLGARYMLAANSLDPDRASDYFDPLSRDSELNTLRAPMLGDYSDEQVTMLETAIDWYFQSAVHGRYMALQEIGFITTRLVGTAVHQGWVPEDEYETLSSAERGALLPANVYAQAGTMLMPDTGEGVVLDLMFTLRPRSSKQLELAAGIAATVSDAQARLGIAPKHVDTSEVLSGEELFDLLCEEEKTRILEEAGS